jgi:iron(III) transport system ATP-binding protein
MITLEVQHLTKRFLNGQYTAVSNISFEMENGEILALVGPSGCGKTTTLRLIAGLERPDSGLIRLNGRVLASETEFISPERRGIGMVFQDHALFPHLTVFKNVAFGLRGQKPAEIHQQVREMLHLVEMEALASRYPHELSGGERQRVALVRALAPHPALLLLDEPFSSLDADLRGEVREQVRSILKSMHATVIFVTHDQEEALFMGDRLAVFQQGCIEQIGTPEQIFHSSATHFVAEFMGDSDFLRGTVIPEGIQTEVGLLPQAVSLTGSNQVEVALRGDDVDFELAETGNGVIIERFFLGAFNVYRLQLDSGQVLHAFKEHTIIHPLGTRVQAYISAGHPLVVFHKGQAVS